MAVNSYYSRKLHSLLGVVPLGFFLIEHFLTNYEAYRGGHAKYLERIEWLNNLPFLFLLELFGIWLPLLYHGVYGLYMAYQSRNNFPQYGYFRNLMFTLQRVTGVVTFVFVTWHMYETRVQVALGNVAYDELGRLMVDILTNPWAFAAYVVGVVCASFHFCNGMWSFLVSWGITVGPRAQRVSTYIWMVAFVFVATVGVLALTAFRDPNFLNS